MRPLSLSPVSRFNRPPVPPNSYVTLRNLSLGREALALFTRKRSSDGKDYYRQRPKLFQ